MVLVYMGVIGVIGNGVTHPQHPAVIIDKQILSDYNRVVSNELIVVFNKI